MKALFIYITIISGAVVLTYFLTGFNFMNKDRLTSITSGSMFLILILALSGIYVSFKKN